MKKILALAIIISFFFISCGKKDESATDKKKSDDVFSNIKYNRDLGFSEHHALKDIQKTNVDSMVYSLRIDTEPCTEKDEIQNSPEKVGKYPVKMRTYENTLILELLLPNDICVSVGSYPQNIKSYQNPELMKKMMALFDFNGLEKISRDKLPANGKELLKYFPNFPERDN